MTTPRSERVCEPSAPTAVERRLLVRDVDDVTLLSRACISTATSLGASVSDTGRLDLVIRELGWNLVRHAGGGGIRLVGLRQAGCNGVLIESRDYGPGIGSLPSRRAAVASRAPHGLGLGLAAIQRNSNEFSLQTDPNGGTFIRVVIWWLSKSL